SGATQEAASLVLQSLPAELQKDIEDVRAACRKYQDNLERMPGRHDDEGKTRDGARGINPDDGLTTFTVSGWQAVMVDQGELCGGWVAKGITYTNRGSSWLAIYVRAGKDWRKALRTDALGRFFLSIDEESNSKFNALVLNVFKGSEESPISIRKVHWS